MRRAIARLPALALVLSACGTTTGSPQPVGTQASTVPPTASLPSPTAPAPSGTSGDVIRIPLSGAAPDAIVLDGSTGWVLTGEGGTLIGVDFAIARVTHTFEVGFGATHVGLPIPGTAAVGRFDSSGTGSYLLLVDLETGQHRGVPTGELGAMTAGEGGIVWALEKADHLLKVDATGATVVDDAAVDVGLNVHVEVQWGAGSAWVGSDGLPVVRLNGESLEVEATINVPTGIPFLFHDGLMWGAGATELWAIDPATNAITRHVPLVNVAEILAVDIDGTDAWLAVRHPAQVGAVLRIDLATGALVGEFPVTLPAAVRLTADRAWVAAT